MSLPITVIVCLWETDSCCMRGSCCPWPWGFVRCRFELFGKALIDTKAPPSSCFVGTRRPSRWINKSLRSKFCHMSCHVFPSTSWEHSERWLCLNHWPWDWNSARASIISEWSTFALSSVEPVTSNVRFIWINYFMFSIGKCASDKNNQNVNILWRMLLWLMPSLGGQACWMTSASLCDG